MKTILRKGAGKHGLKPPAGSIPFDPSIPKEQKARRFFKRTHENFIQFGKELDARRLEEEKKACPFVAMGDKEASRADNALCGLSKWLNRKGIIRGRIRLKTEESTALQTLKGCRYKKKARPIVPEELSLDTQLLCYELAFRVMEEPAWTRTNERMQCLPDESWKYLELAFARKVKPLPREPGEKNHLSRDPEATLAIQVMRDLTLRRYRIDGGQDA